MKKNLNKLIIVAVLIVAVVIVIVLKSKTEKSYVIENKEEIVKSIEISEIDSIETFRPKPDDISQTDEIQRQEIITTKQIEKPVEVPEIKKKAENDILALVNNSQITEQYFNEAFDTLPQQQKDMFKNDKEGFLDQLITKELLFQKAKEKGIKENISEKDEEKLKDKAIETLIIAISSDIEITVEEMINFYNEHESEMKGAAFEQVKSDIRNYLKQQKQGEVINQYIEDQKKGAEIVLNEEWIKVQQASKPKNPLTEVLKNGKPTVLDLGASTCIPCKMMKPIFAELEEEYEGKANILLLEISDYRDIANKYNVRVIPTQIFFDKSGNQYWRHEGFLSKEDIIKKINESGA